MRDLDFVGKDVPRVDAEVKVTWDPESLYAPEGIWGGDDYPAIQRVGRRLDFVAQEMLREANTISSKANDARISQHVVEIKVGIDRLKEQVQNVE